MVELLIAVSEVYSEVIETAELNSLDWILVDNPETRVVTQDRKAYLVVKTRCAIPKQSQVANFHRALEETRLVFSFQRSSDSKGRILVLIAVELTI